MTPDFWSGRRVFLTGHTGFKGGWLALWLAELGARVSGYALAPPTTPNLFTVARVAEGLAEDQRGDIRDAPALVRALGNAAPEIVFHLAAQPLVRASYAQPVETYATNVMGTVHLLEAVRQTPSVRAVIVVTSDKCYDNQEWVWGYRETDGLGGFDPYSSSKGCAEIVTAAWRRSFFAVPAAAAIASARAGNVIGGGDWAEDRLIPDAIRAFRAATPVAIRNPGAIRPWQHVLEPLSGYLCLAERLLNDGSSPDGHGGKSWAEAWNFGPLPDSEQTVAHIISRLVTLWDVPGTRAAWRHEDGGHHPHEAGYLALDSAKARRRLHWAPRWNLDQALEATVSWFAAWHQGADMRALTLEQIAAYTGNSSD